MKKLNFLPFMAFLSFGIFAQTSDSEIERLKKEAGLSKATIVKKVKKPVFPKGGALKFYLAMRQDSDAEKRFADWVTEWNKDNAAKYGKIEVTDDMSAADVIVSQFRTVGPKSSPTVIATATIGKTQPQDDDREILGPSVGRNPKVKVGREFAKFPLFSYVLIREDKDAWNLAYARYDESFDQKTFDPEWKLRGKIVEKMKDR